LRVLACVALLYMFSSTQSAAAELTPFVEDGQLGVAVLELPFPPSIKKDLMSGLTNRVLLRVALVDDAQVVVTKDVELAILYDLWEENFNLTVTINRTVVRTEVYPHEADILSFLQNARLPNLFDMTKLAGKRRIIVRVDALLNPIDRERMDKLKRWVAENSSVAPLSRPPIAPNNGSLAPAPTTTPSNVLFNRIFSQYATGTDLAAAWRVVVISMPFNPEDISSVRH
jgi:hypothetical protein